MMDWHFLSSEKAGILTSTAAGSFVALLITRKYGWLHALTLFGVGQITSFVWTVPLCDAFHWSTELYGPVGFFIGAVGMLIWGAIIALAQNMMDDPRGTLAWLWRTWRGK